jgi:hypothetical protein
MTRRLVRIAIAIAAGLLVGFLIIVFVPLAAAVSYSWRRAFPDRRRSTLPEWIGAASLALLALRVRPSHPRRDLRA